MTAAGRLGRLAALLLLLLPALARGWDWSTNVETTFDCETHRNPIQLYKEELSVCEGGTDAGNSCESDTDCNGGECKESYVCQGGADDGKGCESNTDCAGSGKCKRELADFFGVEELDLVTGKYTPIYTFPWGEANAFAFLDKDEDGEKVYAFACVNENPDETKKYLARFDSTSVTIVEGIRSDTNAPWKEVKQNPYVGAFIKATFYYGSGLSGKKIYYVSAVNTDTPVFDQSGSDFTILGSILPNINDFTHLVETSAFPNLIADDKERSYLVGLGQKNNKPVLFVARIEANGDRPEAYAVLPGGTIDWSIFDQQPCTGKNFPCRPPFKSTFGSAFTYDVGDGIVKPRLLFANNEGVGLFELVIPDGGIDIPDSGPDACWNTGTSDHGACDPGKFTIQWKADSAPTPKNDGSACPRVLAPVLPGDPTFAPTTSPAPTTPAPSAAPSAAPTPLPTTPMPSLAPSFDPTVEIPSANPTFYPTVELPSANPTSAPSTRPTPAPSAGPTPQPTPGPSPGPTQMPVH